MKLRAWSTAAVLVIGSASAFALGKLNILDQFASALQTARAGSSDPAEVAAIDAAIVELQKAPGVGEFDDLAPDIKAAAKSVGKLKPLGLADHPLQDDVAALVGLMQANIFGRSSQAGTVASAQLGASIKLAFVVRALGIINAKASTVAGDADLDPAKKLKQLAALAKKADKIYNKYD